MLRTGAPLSLGGREGIGGVGSRGRAGASPSPVPGVSADPKLSDGGVQPRDASFNRAAAARAPHPPAGGRIQAGAKLHSERHTRPRRLGTRVCACSATPARRAARCTLAPARPPARPARGGGPTPLALLGSAATRGSLNPNTSGAPAVNPWPNSAPRREHSPRAPISEQCRPLSVGGLGRRRRGSACREVRRVAGGSGDTRTRGAGERRGFGPGTAARAGGRGCYQAVCVRGAGSGGGCVREGSPEVRARGVSSGGRTPGSALAAGRERTRLGDPRVQGGAAGMAGSGKGRGAPDPPSPGYCSEVAGAGCRGSLVWAEGGLLLPKIVL